MKKILVVGGGDESSAVAAMLKTLGMHDVFEVVEAALFHPRPFAQSLSPEIALPKLPNLEVLIKPLEFTLNETILVEKPPVNPSERGYKYNNRNKYRHRK